ncbi:MAG: M60 family metallopeptidase [Erysipelotrichales bacterium]|nr:M60 family metallopeptidase [Erysipelotrichales bacterium]
MFKRNKKTLLMITTIFTSLVISGCSCSPSRSSNSDPMSDLVSSNPTPPSPTTGSDSVNNSTNNSVSDSLASNTVSDSAPSSNLPSSNSSSNGSTSVGPNSSNNDSCSSLIPDSGSTSTPEPDIPPEILYEQLEIKNPTNTHVGQTMKVIGNVERTIPEVSNEGLTRYPTYGTSLPNITDNEKDAILSEDQLLRASSTTYDSMDKDGNYYLNSVATGKKLYKHTASENMYYGSVSDDEPAVIKEIQINPRPLGNYITGLYAPAGEIIKIEISDDDLKATGGLSVLIGQTSQNNEKNNIWKARNDFCRMPYIVNEMSVTSTISYVGYALGGPIYISPKLNNGHSFKVTISGAVEYPHFIYGYTTEEEFEAMKGLSAPYFDFEIWDNAVRHSGSKRYVNMDYKNLMLVSKLWMNIVKTSKQVPTGSNSNIGITFLYDPFIAAGAAVAFVGRNWCNLPPDWITSSLDYEAFTSNGMWGTIHEYNHHFQRYGFAPGDEVTNNAINLLSYINYTNISSKRSESDSTLTDWNAYTDPSRSLRETIKKSQEGTPISSLNAYADIIHTFGVDTFIKATQLGNRQGGVDVWYRALSEATGYDMTYYFEEMLHQTISLDVKTEYQSRNLPVFVPVASLYQTGRSYFVNNQELFVETVKPFQIKYGKEFMIDLENHLHVPSGFSYTIEEISEPEFGTLEKASANVYKYIPDIEHQSSGKIKVKISLEHATINTPDVTLTLEFKQEYAGLDAIKYIYSSKKYTTIDDAIANNFEGYESKTELNKYYSTFMNGIAPNMIGVIEGKIYIPEDGEYVICFRSDRGNHVLYTAINSPDVTEKIDSSSKNNNFVSEGDHVLRFNLHEGDYLYFKEYITSSSNSDAYMELGWSKIEEGKTPNVVSIPSKYLMNTNYNYEKYGFTFEEKYKRTYETSSILADKSKQSIVDCNYAPWGDSYKIENVIDGNDNTSFHSVNGKLISSEPFTLTIDLGDNYDCDTLYITGYDRAERHMPITFKLYGGTSLDEMELLGDYVNHPFENRNMTVKFDLTKIRYYRLVVTDTDTHRYVAISEINMGLDFKGIEQSPDVATYYNFKINYETLSTYGHVIEGDGYLIYSFSGTQFGLFTIQNNDCIIEIEIDNGKTIEINLAQSSSKKLTYISELLSSGEHTIKIKVLSGTLTIDSFTYRQ